MYVDSEDGFGTQAKVRESGCNGAETDEGSGLVRTVRLVRGGRRKSRGRSLGARVHMESAGVAKFQVCREADGADDACCCAATLCGWLCDRKALKTCACSASTETYSYG